MHPLVQLQIPPHLCSLGELKFVKTDLSPEEAFEQRAVNCILRCPHHPKLDGVDAKHPIRCLVAAMYYTLWEKLFDKFREPQAKVTDLFSIECKKFFTSVTGRTYDAGKKPTKAEKKEKAAKETELKKQKLEKRGHPSRTVKQEKEKEEPAKTNVNIPGDEDKPMLISDDDDVSDKEGAEKKFTFKKPPLWKPPYK